MIGLRDSRGWVSKQINWIDLLSNVLQIRRTSQFIGHLGVTVWSDLIDGSDETIHREPLWLSHVCRIANGRVRWCHVCMCYKTRETAAVGLWYNAPDAFHCELISTVITPWWTVMIISLTPHKATCVIGDLVDSASTRSTRDIPHAFDPTHHLRPRRVQLKIRVEHSPTRRKWKRMLGYIRCDEIKG